MDDPNFNPLLSTVIYTFGWRQVPLDRSTRAVVEAYLQTNQWNTIVLDWQTLAGKDYTIVMENVVTVGNMHLININTHIVAVRLLRVKVGNILGQQLMYLIESGLPILTIHLVGHSLGGQLSAQAGRYLQKISNHRYKLPRITGLDPAYPFWYTNGSYTPISKSDAIFVDIIHADAGKTGALRSTGTIDFWPNSGFRSQPGCPYDPDNCLGTLLSWFHLNLLIYYKNNLIDLCSHRKSCYFWAESLNPANPVGSFLAVSATSWAHFQNGITNIVMPMIHMGIQAPFG